MKLENLFESSPDLIKLAKSLGKELYSGPSAGRSGFIFTSNPKIVTVSKREFGDTYGTMQTLFKPSKNEAYDKSDQKVNYSKDVDSDGNLYVIDSEVGVIIVSSSKSSASRVKDKEDSWKSKVIKVHGNNVVFSKKGDQLIAMIGEKYVGVFEIGAPSDMGGDGVVFPK